MKIIRATLKDGKKKFINESWGDGLELVSDIASALSYDSELEFKVAWKMLRFLSDRSKQSIVKFESIDNETLKIKKINMEKRDIAIKNTLYFNREDFDLLKKCPCDSSHFLYDKDGEWLLSFREEDHNKTVRMKYYKRGLTNILVAFHVRNHWKNSWFNRPYYNRRKHLLKNPIIQQLEISGLGECKEFTVFCSEKTP